MTRHLAHGLRARRDLRGAAAAGLLGLLPLGCTPNDASRQPRPVADGPAPLIAPQAQMTQADAVPAQQYLAQLAVYKITVPAGSISGSEDFWKRVDEHAVDVPTYELLYKNGVRVGVAPAGEWDYLKSLFEKNPAMTQPMLFMGRDGGDNTIDIKKALDYQNLFYFDQSGELIGRTFERCDTHLRVNFRPAPRKHGSVRLALCPVIRSLRERLVPIGDINQRTTTWYHPEHLFALNLVADVAIDSFLVAAPSPEGKWPTSLGNTFLTDKGGAEQTETVLIFRPVLFRGAGAAPAAAASK